MTRTGAPPDTTYYRPGHHDRDFMNHAACRGCDPELWFPDNRRDPNRRHHRSPHATTMLAKLICSECPVQADCLNYALSVDARYGIYGGLTESQRAKLTGRRAYG